MQKSKALFEAIIVGFDKLNKDLDPKHVKDNGDAESISFYLVVSGGKNKEYVNLGVGHMINGEGVVVSRA
ncbi:MAG: hypothetical protein J7L82_00980 [Staphylothermus sp.]|nr:hypothetical protein [Staphylothermus sp.]